VGKLNNNYAFLTDLKGDVFCAVGDKDVLEVYVTYDPNLDSITLKYSSLSKDSDVLVFDEIIVI